MSRRCFEITLITAPCLGSPSRAGYIRRNIELRPSWALLSQLLSPTLDLGEVVGAKSSIAASNTVSAANINDGVENWLISAISCCVPLYDSLKIRSQCDIDIDCKPQSTVNCSNDLSHANDVGGGIGAHDDRLLFDGFEKVQELRLQRVDS